MKWLIKRFGDIVEFPPKVKLENGDVYDFIPMTSVDGGTKFVQIIEQKEFTGGGAKFENDDTIFARITPCLENGKIAKVKVLEKGKGFGSTEFFVFRAIPNVSDPDYVYYLAKSDVIRQPAIKSMVGASGRQRADKGVVEDIDINVPPLPTQRRIASILSAYDDLIENNLKRIKLLEEAAQNIYREWFVEMRFPGWEDVKWTDDGEGRRLPEGWRYVTFGELISYYIGGGWGKDDVEADYTLPAYVIRGTDMPKIDAGNLKDVPFRYHKPSNLNSRSLEPNDTVFEVSGGSTDQPVGRSLLIDSLLLDKLGVDVICASFCKLIRPDTALVKPYFLYHHLKESYGNGVLSQYESQSASNIRNFKFTDFLSKHSLLLPTNAIMDEFEGIVKPMHTLCRNLSFQIGQLSEASDILLPRLMDRTVEV